MQYRLLGRTGFRVSELGIGGHEYRRWLNPLHFKNSFDMEEFNRTQEGRNEIIKRALDAGINYFDTTLKEEVESIGLALRKCNKRRDVFVAIMVIFPFRKFKENPRQRWRDIILEEIEERLKLLYTDYADIFNIHLPEDNYSLEFFNYMMDLLKELKKQEKIKFIGASSHDAAFLAELIRKYDCFDSVMIRYNYYLKEAKEKLFPLCKMLNVGIIAMKPLSWPYYGIPFIYFLPEKSFRSTYTPIQTAIRWILNSPEVSCVVPSINSIDELEENINTFDKIEPINENILEECLKYALSNEAKETLKKLVFHPYKDISCYAKRALEGL
jgi:aryl-alcohol dehydrogenase-like predicted oxidoreductase